jgi:hypothetical protein
MNRLVAEVVAAWREAERVVRESPDGPERDEAIFAALRLRELALRLAEGPESADTASLEALVERYSVHPSPST